MKTMNRACSEALPTAQQEVGGADGVCAGASINFELSCTQLMESTYIRNCTACALPMSLYPMCCVHVYMVVQLGLPVKATVFRGHSVDIQCSVLIDICTVSVLCINWCSHIPLCSVCICKVLCVCACACV